MKVSAAVLQWFAGSSCISATAASLFSLGKNNKNAEVHRSLEDGLDSIIIIDEDGEEVDIPLSSQVSYESAQDEEMMRPLILSNGGKDITLKGNIHRAIPLPEPLEINYSTMLEFDFTLTQRTEIHAVCVDTTLGIDGKKCFVLGGYQGTGAMWQKMHPWSEQGQTNHYSIPLSKLASEDETYKYLVFMQDNDSSNRNSGQSTFSNIKIIHEQDNPITLEIDGTDYSIPLHEQTSYDTWEDEHGKRPLLVEDNGEKITTLGNMHRAIPLPVPVKISYASTLEVDFTLTEETEAHAICLDDYLGFDARKCFVFAGTQSMHNDWIEVQPQATVGETRHYTVPLGRLWGESEYNWLVFMQDNDTRNRNTGESSFANIKITTGDDYPATIQIDGEEIAIPLANQLSYDRGQDEHMKRPLIIGDEGRSITLKGNTFRALPIPTMKIGSETTLDFDFTLTESAEQHLICLDNDLVISAHMCYVLAGTENWSGHWEKASPLTPVGNTTHYSLSLHKLAWGDRDYKYITFIQDQDHGSRNTGQSTFANIEIKHGNELIVELDDDNVTLASWKELEYWGQDHGRYPLTFPDDGKSIRLQGNTWRTLPLGRNITMNINTQIDFDFTLTQKKEIHAICLNYNGQTEWYPMCLITAGTEHWGIPTHIDPKTQEGETTHYSLPVGLYYQKWAGNPINDMVYWHRTINSISFMLDNDANPRNSGDSTWSNIKIYEVERPKLSIEVNGATMEIESNTVAPMDWWHDSLTHDLSFPDSTSITLKGNTYKALNITEPFEIKASTDLDFDFTLTEEREHHSICVITSTNKRQFWHRYYCFTSAGTNSWHNDVDLNPKTTVGETRHYHYPIGLKVPPGDAYYLGFILDNDSGDRYKGESTWSNIRFSERPPLNVRIESSDTSLENQQFTYGHNQDSVDNIMEVSPSGDKISFRGNLWKAFHFTTPLTITDRTILAFDLEIEELPEIMAICFDEDLHYSSSQTRCIKFAGVQTNGLGPVVYRGIKQTDVTEVNSYAIKLSDYMSGDMNYLAFMHDEDRGNKKGGISHINNLSVFEQRDTCLSDKSFNFALSECTAENFVEQIGVRMSQTSDCGSNPNAWSELMAIFGATSDSEVRKSIELICRSAYAGNGADFNDMMSHEKQFVNEFFDGGNIWNYEVDEAGGANLARDTARIGVIQDKFKKTNVDFPEVHNFEGCDLRAAMCCYPAKRNGASRGDATDNSNACYMDFSKARQSSHVRDGYSIYSGSGNEGGLHCHGFAWGNDYGYHDAAFKGNTLFQVAMVKGLMDDKHVGHLPGAPMCGCVENMPVVTNAGCTRTQVDQTVTITHSAAEQFVASASVRSITHSDCGNLPAYYNTLVNNGKASENEKAKLAKHITGSDCTNVLEEFLGSKGFSFA